MRLCLSRWGPVWAAVVVLAGTVWTWPAGPVRAQEQELSRIVAVVNDELISIYDLSARVRFTVATLGMPEDPAEQDRLVVEVLESLIDERLKVQAAERLAIEVSGAEAEGAYARLAQTFGLNADEFGRTLREQGISDLTVWSKIDADLRWGQIIQRRAIVSASDVDQEMMSIRAAEGQPEYRIRRIVLLAGNDEERIAARTEAGRLLEELGAGTDFGLLALRHSQGLPDPPEGDWVRGDAVDPALAAVLAQMQDGEVSEPIDTPGAVYVVQLLGRRAVSVPDNEDLLRRQAEQVLFRRNAVTVDRSLLRQLRAGALIDRRL